MARRQIVLGLAALLVGLAAIGSFSRILSADSGRTQPVSVLSRAAEERLTAWLLANTRRGVRIAVPTDLRTQLTTALPGRRVVDLEHSTGALVVVTPTGPVPSHAVPIARIDAPGGPVEVQVPLPSGVSAHQQAIRRARADRRLVSAVQLRLTPRAWAALASAKVDVQLTTLLAALCRRHTVAVSSFPVDASGNTVDAAARVVAITAIDGRLVGRTMSGRDLRAMSGLPRWSFRVESGRDQGQPAVLVRALVPGDPRQADATRSGPR